MGLVWVGYIRRVGVTGGALGVQVPAFSAQTSSIHCRKLSPLFTSHRGSIGVPLLRPPPTCCPDLIPDLHPSSSINSWLTSLCASLASASIKLYLQEHESKTIKKRKHSCHKPKVFILGVSLYVCILYVYMTEKKR